MRIVRDKNGRSRGYAFIVFERERDMKGNIIPIVGWIHSPSVPLRIHVSHDVFLPQLHTKTPTVYTSWASEYWSTLNGVARCEDGSHVV